MSVKQAGEEKSKWKERRKRQLRDELIQSAIALFGSKGFEQPSVDQITAATGIAKGTFYLYFKSKSDIVQTVIETELQMLEDAISEAANSASKQAPQALYGVAEKVVSFYVECPWAVKALTGGHLPVDAPQELCQRYHTATAGVCEKIIRRGMLQGYFREVDAKTCALALCGMLTELARNAIEHHQQTDRIAAEAVEYITKGIARHG